METIKYTKKINAATCDVKECTSVQTFYEHCANGDVFEVIPDDVLIHPYFDIDYYDKTKQYNPNDTDILIQYGKTYIIEAFEHSYQITPEFHVKTSSSPSYDKHTRTKIDGQPDWSVKSNVWKISAHLHVSNCKILKSELKDFVVELNNWARTGNSMHSYIANGYVFEGDKFFDESIYNKGMQKLRAWNASKPKENRRMVLYGNSLFEGTIIMPLQNDTSHIIEYIAQNKASSPHKTTSQNQSPSSNLSGSSSQTPSQHQKSSPSSSCSQNFVQKFKDYVEVIKTTKCLENYETWFKFQCASRNIGIPFNVYDDLMKDIRGYDHDNNQSEYKKPNDGKRGSLRWNFIYQLAKDCDEEAKLKVDEKYGISYFNKFKMAAIEKNPDPDGKNEELQQVKSKLDNLKLRFTEEMRTMVETDVPISKIKELKDKHKKDVENVEKELKEALDNAVYKAQKPYFEQFNFKIANKYYEIAAEDKMYNENELKQRYRYFESFINKWIHDYRIREVTKIDFLPPPILVPSDTYNLFHGLKYEETLDDIDHLTKDEIRDNSQIFIQQLWYLCGKNNAALDYMLKYLALIIQEPGTLPNTAILFQSKQGVGKNVFFEHFGEYIIGQQYCLSTAKLDNIIGRFPMISQKLLVIMDEANGKETFLANDLIKSFITAPFITYERKNIDSTVIRNSSRSIFFTNNEFALKFEQSDRRFMALQCAEDKINNIPYFKELIKAFKDPIKSTSFGKFLRDLDLSNFNPTSDRVLTSYYKELQSSTIPLSKRFFMDDSVQLDFSKADGYSGKEIHKEFTFWCAANSSGKKYIPIAEISFLKQIKEFNFITKTKNSKGNQVYRFDATKHETFKEIEQKNLEFDPEICDQFPKQYNIGGLPFVQEDQSSVIIETSDEIEPELSIDCSPMDVEEVEITRISKKRKATSELSP